MCAIQGLPTLNIVFVYQHGKSFFLFPNSTTLVLGSIQCPFQWVLGAVFTEGNEIGT